MDLFKSERELKHLTIASIQMLLIIIIRVVEVSIITNTRKTTIVTIKSKEEEVIVTISSTITIMVVRFKFRNLKGKISSKIPIGLHFKILMLLVVSNVVIKMKKRESSKRLRKPIAS